MLLETVYFCESRVDIWRKLGRYLQILKDHYWFAADLCLPDWPSTEQLCVTYKNCNLKGNWAAESVSVTKCIVLVSDRSISSIYWSGLNCLKVHMYLLQICIFTVCVYVCIYTQILKWFWVTSHLIGHSHLCIKVKFCSWCCTTLTWSKMWKWRGQDLLCSLVGLYMILTQCPGSSSEQSICLSAMFIHWFQSAVCSAELWSLSLWRNPNTPRDVHPWKSTAVR